MDFIWRAVAGLWQTIRPWLTSGAPIVVSGEALVKAAELGKTELVKELLARDTGNVMRSSYRGTALWMAARYGHVGVAEALLSEGTDTVTDAAVASAIIQAATGGHTRIIELLARDHSDQFATEHAALALRRAVEGNYSDTIQALINGGTPADLRLGGEPSALLLAATIDSGCVAALLDGGANPNERDSDGRTALHHASLHNQHTCIRILLASGANLFAKDNEGRLAIDEAPTELVARLLKPLPGQRPLEEH